MGMSMRSPFTERRNIRLVFFDGRICDLTEAMSAGEALQSNASADQRCSGFLLCDSASLRVGKRACPLHPHTPLELGRLYYVLPIRSFQHRLAWSHISSLAAMALPSSATATHVSVRRRSSPLQTAKLSRAIARIPGAQYYLRFLLRRRFLSKEKCCRVDDARMISCGNGPASPEGERAAGGGPVVSSRSTQATSWAFPNICNSPEVNSKYVELLIDRSNSWKPPLFTIHEL